MVKIEVFQCFTNETYKLLQQLRKKKILSDQEYIALGECKNMAEVKSLICKNFSIQEKEIEATWTYIINEVWKWKRSNKQESTVYNNYQSAFIKELLKNNGIYERDRCQQQLLTDGQISTQIKEVEEMQSIIAIRTSKKYGDKTIYAINPEIIKEVRNARN